MALAQTCNKVAVLYKLARALGVKVRMFEDVTEPCMDCVDFSLLVVSASDDQARTLEDLDNHYAAYYHWEFEVFVRELASKVVRDLAWRLA